MKMAPEKISVCRKQGLRIPCYPIFSGWLLWVCHPSHLVSSVFIKQCRQGWRAMLVGLVLELKCHIMECGFDLADVEAW